MPTGVTPRIGRLVFNLTPWGEIMNWYLQALKKYADFSGRARRKEYWFYILFYLIILVVLAICDGFIGTTMQGAGIGILTGIYALAVLIPTLAVAVRRLHDTGRSGWWIFIQLVPIVGIFILLYFLVSDSNPGTNAYGPSPKEGEVPVAHVPT
jgi:uncharacterized membrane protein YhaH (DUF805 family)